MNWRKTSYWGVIALSSCVLGGGLICSRWSIAGFAAGLLFGSFHAAISSPRRPSYLSPALRPRPLTVRQRRWATGAAWTVVGLFVVALAVLLALPTQVIPVPRWFIWANLGFIAGSAIFAFKSGPETVEEYNRRLAHTGPNLDIPEKESMSEQRQFRWLNDALLIVVVITPFAQALAWAYYPSLAAFVAPAAATALLFWITRGVRQTDALNLQRKSRLASKGDAKKTLLLTLAIAGCLALTIEAPSTAKVVLARAILGDLLALLVLGYVRQAAKFFSNRRGDLLEVRK